MRRAVTKVHRATCLLISQSRGIPNGSSRHKWSGSINTCKLHCQHTNSSLPSHVSEKQLACRSSIRFYCTTEKSEHKEDGDEENVTRSKLLQSALLFVKDCGWTEEAIIEGVKAAGYSKATHRMFKHGAGDLALHFYRTSNEKLYESLRQTIKDHEGTINTSEFIKDAIKERIRMTTEHQGNWHEAMAHLSHPYVASESLNLLAELVDEIWHLAGDKSSDFNWYTKRALLASIYKASELYMLQDKSVDFEDTWKFVDRRFEDSHSLSSLISHMNSFSLEDAGTTLRSAFTVGGNMLGLRR